MTARVRACVIATLALAAGACGHWAASRCRTQYGYVDAARADPVWRQTLARVAARCVQEGGTDCDAAKFISREAAECIARAARLPAGLGPWEAGIVYNYRHRTVIWSIQSTTSRREGWPQGRVLLIHATSGRVLERSAWSIVS